MAIFDDDIELITRYIDGELLPEDEAIWKNRIKDKDFVFEVQLQQAAVLAIRDFRINEIKKELKEELPVLIVRKGLSDVGKTIYWAAAVIVLLIAATVALINRSQPDSMELFLAYYKPYPASVVTRGKEQAPKSNFLEWYSRGDYKLALKELQSKKTDSLLSDQVVQLYIGNCYLNLDSIAQAIETFEKVQLGKDEILRQHGEWYHSMALLKANEMESARQIWESMVASHSIYAIKAHQLLEK